MEPIKEVFADIRNKLQPCKTVLEAVLLKKNPSVHLIEIAIAVLISQRPVDIEYRLLVYVYEKDH